MSIIEFRRNWICLTGMCPCMLSALLSSGGSLANLMMSKDHLPKLQCNVLVNLADLPPRTWYFAWLRQNVCLIYCTPYAVEACLIAPLKDRLNFFSQESCWKVLEPDLEKWSRECRCYFGLYFVADLIFRKRKLSFLHKFVCSSNNTSQVFDYVSLSEIINYCTSELVIVWPVSL